MEFSLSESTSFEVGGGISVTTAVFGMSVNANYARKFDQSASASSSIAARMVSLPPPENLISFLRKLTTDESKTTESIN